MRKLVTLIKAGLKFGAWALEGIGRDCATAGITPANITYYPEPKQTDVRKAA